MQIADKYSPQEIEQKWYDYWIDNRLFHSEPDGREPYTIVIPPPNVTGMLHMGHMLNNTLQDVLIRRARMSGKNACWVPGMDHASIATEAKVVAMLHEKGIEKSSLTREEFLEYAWEWKEKYGGMILRQLRKLGASCDWERTCFTMDEPRTESVIKVFCDLFEKGRIYRGVRMVNWDPAAKTALSDEEVVFKESHGKLYYLRYMDPHNDQALVGRAANEYWRNVDLYVGGIEHATGHLMYSRFWNMFLYDLGYVCEPEPFKKLVNQGMIQGRSNFVYRVVGTNKFVSLGLKDQYKTQEIHVDVNIVRNDILDLDAFRAWRPEFKDAEFILEEGRYVCGWAIEKMSKSMFNVVNPDYIVDNYGADTLRIYEMFLGPLEQSKPWDTNGIDGVHKFLRRFWALFYNREGQLILTDEKATDKELKTLHKTIKKVREDIENFSFNTSVAAFMICLNELGGCPKREILEPLTVLLAPFAPHIAEELWHTLGHTTSVCDAQYPVCEEKYLVESSFEYPVSVNGKLRFKKEYALTLSPADIQADIVRTDEAQKWLEGKAPKKIIVVPGKIINIVI